MVVYEVCEKASGQKERFAEILWGANFGDFLGVSLARSVQMSAQGVAGRHLYADRSSFGFRVGFFAFWRILDRVSPF